MSHEIEILADGTASMFWTGETPWHGLGVPLKDSPQTSQEAMEAAGLDWEVGLKDLAVVEGEDDDAKIITRVHHKATVRLSDKKVLGVVGPRYRPLQNRDAFKTFEPFLKSGKATFETAGSLRGGTRVWVLAKINSDNLVVVPGDEIRKYILLSHAHDGTLSIFYGVTGIRVVCANTEALARQKGGLFRAKHTESATKTLMQVSEVISAAENTFTESLELYRFLANRYVSKKLLNEYVSSLFGVDINKEEVDVSTRTQNQIDNVLELFEKAPGNDLEHVRGTWWGALNAYSYWLSHERGRSGDSRLDSLWFGQAYNDNQTALDLALKLAS